MIELVYLSFHSFLTVYPYQYWQRSWGYDFWVCGQRDIEIQTGEFIFPLFRDFKAGWDTQQVPKVNVILRTSRSIKLDLNNLVWGEVFSIITWDGVSYPNSVQSTSPEISAEGPGLENLAGIDPYCRPLNCQILPDSWP
jgi:hypothetical protein